MKEEFIKNTPLFGDLTDDEQRAIGKRMRLEHYSLNDLIFARGSESEALYLIKEGWVKLSGGDGGSVVASLGPGSLMGETDFFLGRPYTLTAQASGEVAIWSLSQEAMVSLIADRSELGLALSLTLGKGILQFQNHLTERLGRIPFLQDLSPREQSLVAQYLVPRRYYVGETIYRSGDPPTGLFFIERGAIRLLGDDDEDYSELTYNEAFGEMAAIAGKPHTNTAQAASEVIVWQLSSADFQSLTATYPSIKTNLSRNLRARLGASDRAYALAVLRRNPIFSELSRDALQDATSLLLSRFVPSGEIIFSHGDPGDAMYIVDSGAVNVLSDSPGRPSEVRRRFNEGDFFGETALLTGRTRTFTAQAVSDTMLWCLYRTDFDNLLVKHPQISMALSQTLRSRLETTEDYAVEPHLKKIAQRGGLSRTQLDELSALLQPRRYQGGSTVYYEGSSSNEMYFIERGQVELWATTTQGPVLLETLGESDYFGEIALLSGRDHLGTAYALVETDIWALTKADFDDFLQRYPNLGVTLSRILSERMEETMSRLRGAPAQRSLPPPVSPVSRPVSAIPPSDLSSPSGPQYSSAPNRPAAMPPVPVRPVAPSAGPRPIAALPAPGYSTGGSPHQGPPTHSQFTQPMPPVSGPGSPGIHSQHTHGMPPVPLRPASLPSQAMPPQSRPGQTNPAQAPPAGRKVRKAGPPGRKAKKKNAPSQSTGLVPAASRSAQPAASAADQPGSRRAGPKRSFSLSQLLGISTAEPGRQSQPEARQPRSISNRRLSRYNRSVSVWFAKRTLGAKLRLLAICIALIWICGIMAPSLIINALASTFADEGALPGDERSPLQQMREDGAVAAVGVLPFVETATATPTSSPTPTDTPTQTATPTNTPIPTNTPSPTMTPTPTETPTPVFTPTPTDTPTRAAAVARAPAAPTDTPTPEPTPTPNVDYRVKSVRQLTPCENQSKHHIFIKVEDPSGQGINGVPVKIEWSPVPDGHVIATTETKTSLTGQPEAGRIDFAMFKGSYIVEVMAGSSDITEPVTPDYGVNEACGENAVANSLYHISFEIIFQRTF